jgi:hypothetical protein
MREETATPLTLRLHEVVSRLARDGGYVIEQGWVAEAAAPHRAAGGRSGRGARARRPLPGCRPRRAQSPGSSRSLRLR